MTPRDSASSQVRTTLGLLFGIGGTFPDRPDSIERGLSRSLRVNSLENSLCPVSRSCRCVAVDRCNARSGPLSSHAAQRHVRLSSPGGDTAVINRCCLLTFPCLPAHRAPSSA